MKAKTNDIEDKNKLICEEYKDLQMKEIQETDIL